MMPFGVSLLAPPRDADGHGYMDVLASDLLSVGFSIWPAGVEDGQRPHAEDEVYHVLAGRATIRVDGEDRSVGPGSVVYAAAGVAHRFHSIEEELRMLVF